MASSLCTKWVFIFATSEAKSDEISASLIFLVHEIQVLGLLLKRVVEGKGWGWNFCACGVIMEKRKGVLAAI
ncbi:hypothetical protein FH972_004771 [Carpinus fangiana]|uniref:Uncharacterized protein n=1 Tax=Carpinus fangiana TaxID=176857 RepID=A0A5N6QM67_9ROSI|nr:hypothetical protein FH972_004771 [Carpinus fangiana]